MTKIAPVKTAYSKKALWFDAGELKIKVGDKLVVETARGIEFGTLVEPVFEASKKQLKSLKSDLKPVKRIAKYNDIKQAEKMEKKGKEALPVFKKFAAETNEQMAPSAVEFLLDGKKAVFYFSAPERQDFRDLVKKLSSEFRLRVDMRQINERDEASMVGGIGICGQELCCKRLGKCPKHVSIKMAKTQGMSLNPENISGMCGKLLCCLDYEFEEYDKYTKSAPKLKARVLTPEGEATVVDINMPLGHIELMVKESEKRVKVPLKDMQIDKNFAKKISGGNLGNIRPNSVNKKAWDEALNQSSKVNLESVYVSSSLTGSEKLASGNVRILPGTRKRDNNESKANKSNFTKNDKSEKNIKSIKKRVRKKNRANSNKEQPRTNVYESNSNTRVRRRSRTIDAGSNSKVKPGHKSSHSKKHN